MSSQESSPIRTILDDLYVSTHNGKTPSDIDDDGADQKDLDQAETALNTYVEERVREAKYRQLDTLIETNSEDTLELLWQELKFNRAKLEAKHE